MIPARLRRVVDSDDSGTALVLALLVVLVVGVTMAAVLDFTRSSLSLAPELRTERNTSTYTQGAVDAAIDRIRGSSLAGRGDTTCPTYTAPAGAALQGIDGKTFTVECSGVSSSGGPGIDQPYFAIHTLGTGGDGIRQVAGNAQLTIDGGIYSRGIAGVTGGGSANAMQVYGSINAEGDCVGAIRTTDSLGPSCPGGTLPFGTDPGYGSAIPDDTALAGLINTASDTTGADPVPQCDTIRGDRVLRFSQGYYGSTPRELAAKLAPSCSASTYVFDTGRYYFDYAGDWNINGVQVVAGDITGDPGAADFLGKACDATQPGVQFVFGGSATVSTRSSSGSTSGGMELCGPHAAHTWNGAPQRIAVYGLSSNNPVSNPGPVDRTWQPTAVDSQAPNNSFTPENAVTAIDNVVAASVPGELQTVTVTYAGTPTSAVEKGAAVERMTARVVHRLENSTAALRFTHPTDGTNITKPLTSCTPITIGIEVFQDCSVTVAASEFTGDVPWRTIRGLQMSYVATGNRQTGSTTLVRAAVLDGVSVSVRSTSPALRAQTCTTGCLFFESRTNPNVFVHGTVYTPTAGWAVNVHNSGETIFDRGVIMRDLEVSMSSSSKQTSAPFQIPKATPGVRRVLFRGYADGVEKVRACVTYTDAAPMSTGSTTAFPGYATTVTDWLVLRGAAGPPSCT